jgi:hypothetical protein
MTASNKSDPKQLICAFIGSATAYDKANSTSFGKDYTIERIISPSTTQLHTTKTYVHHTYMSPQTIPKLL